MPLPHSVPHDLNWQWARLDHLSAPQLYAVFAAREAVFVVEQACAYQELDGLDWQASHLIAWAGAEVAGYLRVLGPGTKFDAPSFGRVFTAPAFRGAGLGRGLVAKALEHIAEVYPGHAVRISAQVYLERFYRSCGFEAVSAPYLEDGVPHVEMLRPGIVQPPASAG